VRKNDALVERDELHETEKPATPARPATAWRRERLIEAVERRLVVTHEHTFGAPRGEELARVLVLRVALTLRENQLDDVVRMPRRELGTLRPIDDVVRRSYDAREPAGACEA